MAAASPNIFVNSSLPVLVAGDGHVVDVLCEVERRGCRVSLVIEGPVLFRTVVKQFRVRKIDPVLQTVHGRPRRSKLARFPARFFPARLTCGAASSRRGRTMPGARVGRDGRGLGAVVVPVNAIRNRRLETLFRRCRISGAAASDGAVVDYPLPGKSIVA